MNLALEQDFICVLMLFVLSTLLYIVFMCSQKGTNLLQDTNKIKVKI